MTKYAKMGRKDIAWHLINEAELHIDCLEDDMKYLPYRTGKQIEAKAILFLELAKRELGIGRYKK